MANVKITDLTELAAVDIATNDVLPIVDINTDTTKKVTISSLSTGVADANDFVTFTRLNANINLVQDNVAGLTSTLTIRGDNASDDTVTLGSETLTFKGDTGLTSTVAANVVTFDLDDTAVTAGLYGGVSGGVTNVAAVTIDATGRITNAANVSVVTNLDTLQDNINVLDANADGIEARRVANVFFTYNPTGAANVIINTANLEPSANNTYSLGAPDKVWKDLHVGPGSIFIGANTALKADANGDVQIVQSTDNTPRTLVVDRLEIGTGANKVRLQNNGGRLRQINRGNPNVADDSASDKDLDNVQSNVAAVEARRVANVTVSSAADTALQARLTTNVNSLTTSINTLDANADAIEARRVANVTVHNTEDTALQARLTTNVTALTTEDTALQARITANNTLTTAVETRRTQNIAGAVSTIAASDLTASRALVSSGSGKVDVSAVTATELGHLDGVSSAIQTQLDGKAALAGATFTGQVNMSDDLVVTGNLTVNGDTTTVSTTNLDVEDRMIMLADGVTGSPSADVGLLFNRGNQGNAAIFYDESATTFKLSDTKDPKSNTSLSPVSAANLVVGMANATTLNATTITQNGATLDNLIGSNVDGAISTVNDTDLTASRALVSSSGGKIEVSAVTATEVGYLDGVSSAIQTQLDTKSTTSNATALAAEDVALQSRLATNVTSFTNEDTALQARITANAATAASNDFITFTRLNANINLVQDNVASVTVGTASDTETRLNANLDVVQDNVAAVESRRTANIAGGVSTITTSDLTASRALVSSGSGKVAVSDVTATELGHLDGVTSAIQTQLDAKAALAGATFTGDVTFTGDGHNVVFDKSDNALKFADDAKAIFGAGGDLEIFHNGSSSFIKDVGQGNLLMDASAIALRNENGLSMIQFSSSGYAEMKFGTSFTETKIRTKSTGVTVTGEVEAGSLDISGDVDVDGTLETDALSINGTAVTATATELNLLDGVTATTAELNHVDGVTSAIQTQLDAKLASAGANNFTSNVTITSTDAGAAHGPELALTRNSASPANNDFLGKIVFNGENDADEQTIYGTIFARTTDVTDGTEDGNMSFKVMDDGTVSDRLALRGGDKTLFMGENVRLQNRLNLEFSTSSGKVTTLAATNGVDPTITLPASTGTLAITDDITNETNKVETRRTQNIAGAVSTITTSDLTASRAMVTNGSGKVAVSDVTSTELGYLDGVTSAVQTQLDAKAALAGATFTGQVNMSDDLVVTGNLTVNGVTTTVSTTNLDVEDRLIMLADGTTGSPSADVGILFNRGNQGNAALFYDESAQTFKLADTLDPKSNTSLSPVTASNLDVGTLTTNGDVNFDGFLYDARWDRSRSELRLDSFGRVVFGPVGAGLEIYAGSSSSVISDMLGHELRIIQQTADKDIVLKSDDGSDGIADYFRADGSTGSAILYHYGSQKLATASGGISVTGEVAATSLDISGDVDVDGTLETDAFSINGTSVTATATELNLLDGVTATTAELNHVDGVTSAIQTQLDAKQATITGAATTIDDSDLTASRALVSSGSGKVAVSAVTSTELGYLDGVSSAIQTQLDAKLASAGANNFTDNVTITSTSAGAENNPEFALVRTSSSPANNDLLGTFVFKGKNDAAEETVYASFQTRANDVSDGTEDGNMFCKVMEDGTLSDRLAVKGANPTLFSGKNVRLNEINLEFRTSSNKVTTLVPPTGAEPTITLPSATGTLATTTTTDALETSRAANIAGAVSTITTADLTASRALVSGSGGKVEVSAITSTELAFLDGITQNINSNLAALAAGIAGASDTFPTGDYGLLDAANSSTDAFASAIAG